jgi:hypothetical protein
MFDSRTHFAQVPLEVVQKIVEEQIQKEATSEAKQPIDDETLNEEVQAVARGFIVQPLTLSKKETPN